MNHTEELLITTDYLEFAVDPEKFDMGSWRVEWQDDEGNCGTTCCVIGHYVSLFPKAGLVLACDKEVYQSSKGEYYKEFWPMMAGDCLEDPIEVLSEYFDISKKDVEWLFLPSIDFTDTPYWVAQRIREYIRNAQQS